MDHLPLLPGRLFAPDPLLAAGRAQGQERAAGSMETFFAFFL
jgi:hypothetical protein